MIGEQPCKYEFGQCVLSRFKGSESNFAEGLQKVVCLGFAPSVTNGCFVMRVLDSGIELTAGFLMRLYSQSETSYQRGQR